MSNAKSLADTLNCALKTGDIQLCSYAIEPPSETFGAPKKDATHVVKKGKSITADGNYLLIDGLKFELGSFDAYPCPIITTRPQ